MVLLMSEPPSIEANEIALIRAISTKPPAAHADPTGAPSRLNPLSMWLARDDPDRQGRIRHPEAGRRFHFEMTVHAEIMADHILRVTEVSHPALAIIFKTGEVTSTIRK